MPASNPTHANEALMTRLFTALHAHDHVTMASCYHDDAEFRDIAFHRKGREEIHQMWRMICTAGSNIEVADIKVVEATDTAGLARVVENYTVRRPKDQTKRWPVHNEIESTFVFKDGKIFRQDDECDAKEWARQAVGGPIGFLAGRLRFLRSMIASRKLKKFLDRPAG